MLCYSNVPGAFVEVPGQPKPFRTIRMRTFRYVAFSMLLCLSAAARQIDPSSFHIAILDGEGALNNIQGRVAREPVVQVEDKDHKPVAGAYVEFDTPSNGAGASFANGSTHFATTTNTDGLATASGLRNNGLTGGFVIVVHVAYQGQSIGELNIHQTNVPRKVANISNTVQNEAKSVMNDVSVSSSSSSNAANVVGIALGDQFLINGSSTPSNANLLRGSRIQTVGTPATLYLHDHCEYLVGPHSSVTIQPKLVTVETGAVRAKHSGDCKLGYGGLWVWGSDPNADGVVAIVGDNMEVGSVTGQLQVANTLGEVVGTVSPGSVSNFGTTTAASGATVGAPPLSRKMAFTFGMGSGIALAGLGLAIDAFMQPVSTSP